MNQVALSDLLDHVASGELSVDAATAQLAGESFSDIGFAKVDTGRAARTGAGEVVYGAGKTASQIAEICLALADAGQQCVLVTRLDEEKAASVADRLRAADCSRAFEYRELPKLGIYGSVPQPSRSSYIAVACAGTSDLYCAEEAAVTAEVLGSRVVRLYDVGVAGIHRLLSHADDIRDASCVVACAGMEGALASVVAGMASCPVIAVPTSVGYGASFNGLAALLAMLNSCASGVSVVNIDNGFGAGFQAHMIEKGQMGQEGTSKMKTLRWNLTENATRAQILGDTLLQLPEGAREKIEAAAVAAGVPERHHHDISEVSATIDALAVSDRVRADMHAIYDILAQAEATAHGVEVNETHFHEVGEGLRIRNTLLVCLAVEAVGADRVIATHAQTGAGTIQCAHGELAIPAPATAAIIKRGIPTCANKLPGERMTPTSAAIILHFVNEFN
jgi:NCAIR mutase (PurE)-related protein